MNFITSYDQNSLTPERLGYRVAAWIGYCWLLPDIIGYFPYSFKIYELPGGRNVWK